MHNIRYAQAAGLRDTEITELLMHAAVYAGWPAAVDALTVVADVPDPGT